ncbi:uncharacterized protein LOC108734657 isoform X2 [Agrilus planipennis]|uniref:Uncharacterized protein LOC108734657 isoform X2 n=1 Tax=Agrilus planipennis TaxID=224129 RepID=A0A1W4WNW4_AGRPL|nr:uncharacterized protein LOC108734657 isoform X2 [Agrilus planipennis]
MSTNEVRKLWGEIPKEEINFAPDVSADIEMAMNNIRPLEYDNCTLTNNSQKIEYVSLEPTDPLVSYAITLHKYINDMSDMIRVAELAIESDLIPPEDATSPIPEMPDIVRKHTRNNLNYIPKDFTAFSLGQCVEVPELSKAAVRQLLSKCVATLFAHIGFETSHQSVLDVLIDVVDAFFKKITFHLKLAEEDEERDSCGFPHTIERVLTELGFGGMRGLHDYYQTRIVKYITILQKRCEELNKHYKTLLIPKSISPVNKLSQ